MTRPDPLERIIADALDAAGVAYISEQLDKPATASLDFRVGNVYIECKAYHTPRVTEQMARVDNIIVIQGRAAAELLAELIRGARR